MRYIYKKSCPINVDNWDDFLIKNNPDYFHFIKRAGDSVNSMAAQ